MRPYSRTIAGGVTAAVLGGGVTAALLLGPSPTGAAPPTSSEVVDTDETESDDTDAGDAESTASDRETRLRELLQPLVDSGALTEEEANALVAELATAIPGRAFPDFVVGPDIFIRPGFPGAPDMPGGRGDGGPRLEHRLPFVGLDVIAEAIGIDAETLREQLEGGATVAEIAEANGVDPQVVIDALVAQYTEQVTSLVEGEQEAADEPPASEATEDDTESTETTSA